MSLCMSWSKAMIRRGRTRRSLGNHGLKLWDEGEELCQNDDRMMYIMCLTFLKC